MTNPLQKVSSLCVALAVLAPAPVVACSCEPGTFARSLFEADRVFVGSPVAMGPGHSIAQLGLPPGALSSSFFGAGPGEYVFKDSAEEHLAVVTGNGFGDCGTPLELGKMYLVFGARIDSEHYYVGLCGPSAIPITELLILLAIVATLTTGTGYALLRIVRRLRRSRRGAAST